jgi:hypothetical protein
MEAVAHGDDYTQNLVLNSISRGESSAYAGHCGGKDHIASNVQENGVIDVPVVNASSIQIIEETDSVLNTTKLQSLVGKDQERMPTISALTYVAEGDYSIDYLDRM